VKAYVPFALPPICKPVFYLSPGIWGLVQKRSSQAAAVVIRKAFSYVVGFGANAVSITKAKIKAAHNPETA
jgi:hypothetical protein